MSDAVGIRSIGTYVPRARLTRAEIARTWGAGGRGPQAAPVCGFDEDVITMAVEAAHICLDETGLSGTELDALYFASCSSPFEEHSAAAEVARPLGLAREARLVDLSGSLLGGMNAIIAACEAVGAGSLRRALVLASESRVGEPGGPLEGAFGAGAVAVLIDSEAVGLALRGSATRRHGVPTQWRNRGEVTVAATEDARFEREQGMVPASVQALQAAKQDGRVDFLAPGRIGGGALRSLLGRTGLKEARHDAAIDRFGDLGNGAPLFDLRAGWLTATVGEIGLTLAYESGTGATALRFEVLGEPNMDSAIRPTTGKGEEINYVSFLRRHGIVAEPDATPIVAHAASPAALRTEFEEIELHGHRCRSCGSVNFPHRAYCIDCGAEEFDPVELPRFGKVVTHNMQHVVPVSPEPPPVAVGVVRLDGLGGVRGGQVSGMFTDTEAPRIGMPVELVYRRLGRENGLVKYGWKFRAVEAPAEEDSR